MIKPGKIMKFCQSINVGTLVKNLIILKFLDIGYLALNSSKQYLQ